MPLYGWRIAFILGGLGGVLSFLLRRSMEESPEFARLKGLASRQPFGELLRTHSRQVLVGSAVLAGTACFNGLFFSYLPAYLSVVLKYDPRQAVFSQTAGVLASAGGILLAGWLGDRIPPRYLLRAGVTLLIALRAAVLRRARSALDEPDAAVRGRRPLRRPDEWVLCGAADGSLPNAHPLHRRRAGVQRQLHACSAGWRRLPPARSFGYTGSVVSPAYLMMGSALLALVGSVWVNRFGGNVLVGARA